MAADRDEEMKMDKFHCFGSRWFCLQMQQAFDRQSNFFSEILQTGKSEKFRQVLPLVNGVKETASVISGLLYNRSLNEAHVLMRLLTERVINLCFLLVASEAEIESVGSTKKLLTLNKESKGSVEDLIKAASQFHFTETYDHELLEKKLTIIQQRSEVPKEFLCLAIASHFPIASEAMSGSAVGAVCHLKPCVEHDSEKYFQEEFSTLFFTGTLLLAEAISVIAKTETIIEIFSRSKQSLEKATDLMNKIKEPIEGSVQDLYGFWDTLQEVEYHAEKSLCKKLADYEDGFRLCVETGVQVTTLKHTNRGALQLKCAALFLKRLLNDLRTIWLMLNHGYTSQAASVSASLFENALVVQVVSKNKDRALKLQAAASEKLPWDVAAMCKMVESDTKAESLRRCESNNEYIFSLDETYDLDGNVPWNPARFLNHSCEPNCEAEPDGGCIWIVARRDIRTGEEITFNYGYDLDDYREHPCRCGAADCAGYIVAAEFFEHVKWQSRLAPTAATFNSRI
jgi:hypothetical protein